MRAHESFRDDEAGNITIMFAYMLVLVLLFTGGAVDFTRRNAVRADLIESLDAAGLAIAQLDESNTPEMASMTATEKEAYLKEYGTKFFHENFSHENEVENFSLDFDINAQAITPTAGGEIKTLFLGAAFDLLGWGAKFNSLQMAADTEITRRGSGPIELALVLDITGSMADEIDGVAKIESLRDASDALLNVLYGDADDAESEYVLTSVVPFSRFVNPGGSEDWNNAWADTGALASYHGAHFIHTNASGVPKPNTKVNHFNLYNSLPTSGGDPVTTWAGCVEERPFPLDEIDTNSGAAALASTIDAYNDAPAGVTNALVLDAFNNAPAMKLTTAVVGTVENSRFVPMFVADSIDCDGTDGCAYGSSDVTHSNGIVYNGSWFDDPDAASHDEGDYDNRSVVDDDDYTRFDEPYFGNYLTVVNYTRRVQKKYWGGSCSTTPNTNKTDAGMNTWLSARGATSCSTDEYILRDSYVGWWNSATQTYTGKYDLPMTIDESINEATGDESTSGPNWGCVAPLMTGTNEKSELTDYIHALAPSGNTNSAVGMMWGWRVLSPEAPFESEIPYNDNKWQKAVVLMTDGFNTVGDADTHWGSDLTAYGYASEERMGAGINTPDEMRDEFDAKLLRICTRMKEEGILIYAITFGLSDTDDDEAATKDVFQACASEAEAPYYFDAPDGEELEDAFADIAADLVQLHVSR